MKKGHGYQVAIGILLLIVVLQWVFFIRKKPAPLMPKAHRVPVAVLPVKGKIAVVLDDWGYSLNNLYVIEQIKYPLTASVLPNLEYSRRISEELHRRGFEIILHLPMEPRERKRMEKNTITVSLGEKEIKDLLDRDLENVSYADGVSNHMGSLATTDLRTMKIVFKELKAKHLYFLDSLVTSKSICSDLAGKMGLRFARREVFLDNRDDPGYIREQINQLKIIAAAYGEAIGIGHDRKNTLLVLKEMMPQLKKEGYKFVFVSELAK